MLLITFLVLLVLSLGQWLLTPLIRVFTPLLSLEWVGWSLLGVGLWLFAGSESDDPPPATKLISEGWSGLRPTILPQGEEPASHPQR